MKHHKDIDELLHNSNRNKTKRAKRFIILALVLLALALSYQFYLGTQAKAYKAKAMRQQEHAMVESNIATDKAILYFQQLKQLTANYTK